MNKFALSILSTTICGIVTVGILRTSFSIVKANQIPALKEASNLLSVCAFEEDLTDCRSPLDDVSSNLVDSVNLMDGHNDDEEPSLQPMPTVDFKAYVQPDISTFYSKEPGTMNEKKPSFLGQAGKYVNISPHRVSLYWDPGNGRSGVLLGHIGPFEASGTATFPGHLFYLTPDRNPNKVFCRFEVVQGTSVYFYDPYTHGEEPGRCKLSDKFDQSVIPSLNALTQEEMVLYNKNKLNLKFGEMYKNFTGAEWLTMYPRSRPRHKIWAADYFGQTHSVQTKETHFLSLPPETEMPSMSMRQLRRNGTETVVPLQSHRIPAPSMNLTLTTISCAPRAFEIRNFLSDVEVDHIIELAIKKNLQLSTTGDAENAKTERTTRSSTNTWVSRYSSPVVDAVYRRVSDVLRMDEALLRHRESDEYPELGTQPLSEELQLVHYDEGQEYTAHHDFGYSHDLQPNSPSRSINVLLYLNEVIKGGETSFPKWRNAETSAALDVKPEKGKAVIFYMLLPDGNKDDATQHAALPVKEGEKWLANLWVWDPVKN